MKVKIRTLQGREVELDLNTQTDSVAEVKVRVGAMLDIEVGRLVLIHAGRILNDDLKLADYPQMKEGDRIVAMAQKTAAPRPTPEAPAERPAERPAEVPQPTENQSSPTGASESTIESLVAMGFERPKVEVALRAAFGNPDRAVEYLTNGLPPHLVRPMPPAEGQQTETAAEGAMSLETLRNHPLFHQMRAAVQANPSVLPMMINHIAQQNPELAELIVREQDAFLEMLAGDEGAGETGTTRVTLTEEEIAAVARLEELGFPRAAAIQAYLAFDKNEQLAANFLFDNLGDFEDEE